MVQREACCLLWAQDPNQHADGEQAVERNLARRAVPAQAADGDVLTGCRYHRLCSDPGDPDELVRTLRNWLREASNPIGSLPTGTDSVEWAFRRFIAWRVAPLRGTIDEIEDCLRLAKEACRAGDTAAAAAEIDSMRQIVGESLRDHLGLYSWNEP